MPEIKAAVCDTFGDVLTIETIRLYAPKESEIEVKLRAFVVCHLDISYVDGAWGGTLHAVYGHEAAGEITALGASIHGLSVRDRVVVTLIRTSGHCTNRGSNKPTICETPVDRTTGPLSTTDDSLLENGIYCGVFSERSVVHQRQVVKISNDIAYDLASLLACGVVTGIGAVVNAAKARLGKDVVVISAGGVGLITIHDAHITGAGQIVAVDMRGNKLTAAKEFSATLGFLETDRKPWKAAKAIFRRGADAVFVTVGAISAYDTAPHYLAFGGQIVAVGVPNSGVRAVYEPVMMSAVSQILIRTKMGDVVIKRDIPWIVDSYQQGRLKLDQLISGRYKVEDINEAFAETRSVAARHNFKFFDT